MFHVLQRIYRMSSVPRGFCVIVNMKDFYRGDERLGSDNDVTNLKDIWSNLGYDVITWINKSSSVRLITIGRNVIITFLDRFTNSLIRYRNICRSWFVT